MTTFRHLRRHRRRIARSMLAVFVTTWAALAWQPCVHAFDGLQHEVPSAHDVEECLHCPPKVAAEEPPSGCCLDKGSETCTDIEQSASDGRPTLNLLPPAVVAAWLPNEIFADLRRAVFLPVQGDASRRAPHRPLILTFGVLLN